MEGRSIEFAVSYEESGPGTPIFFILSPGVDPLKDVEALGRKLGFTTDNKNLHSVSLGQGQEIVAEKALDLASQEGHWVVLQVSFFNVISILFFYSECLVILQVSTQFITKSLKHAKRYKTLVNDLY